MLRNCVLLVALYCLTGVTAWAQISCPLLVTLKNDERRLQVLDSGQILSLRRALRTAGAKVDLFESRGMVSLFFIQIPEGRDETVVLSELESDLRTRSWEIRQLGNPFSRANVRTWLENKANDAIVALVTGVCLGTCGYWLLESAELGAMLGTEVIALLSAVSVISRALEVTLSSRKTIFFECTIARSRKTKGYRPLEKLLSNRRALPPLSVLSARRSRPRFCTATFRVDHQRPRRLPPGARVLLF